MLTHTRSRALVGALILVVLGSAAVAMAQEAPRTNATDAQNWRDFIHFIRIARPDAALAYGQALLDTDVNARTLYQLSEETGGTFATLARGERSEALAETVKALRARIEQGYRQASQDPLGITSAIDLLGGNIRQYATGTNRLKLSGEYALPQMIQRLADPATGLLLRDRIATVMGRLGKPAVHPLCEALVVDDASVREIVCQSLGQIGYGHAAPYLKAVLDNPNELDRVKDAAEAALIAITGDRAAAQTPLATYYYELAEKYYNGDDSIQPDPRFDAANVWYWRKGLGLTYIDVPRAIYQEVYAMRTARAALMADQAFTPAVTLWLQANIRKEANLPAGVVDPTRGETQLSADAHAKAAGTKYMQGVLARGLAATETAVVKGAIRALSRTTGASNLAVSHTGVTPLVAALTYPDLRVRLMAAETLANARPSASFSGSQLVVRVLVESLRQTGRKTALLIEPDANDRNRYKDMVRKAGYEVVSADSVAAGLSSINDVTGVDIVLMSTRVEAPGAEEALTMLRKHPKLSLLPVVLTAHESTMVMARRIVRSDDLIVLQETEGLDQAALVASLAAAAASTMGDVTMDEAEAYRWAMSATQSLRLLGLTRTEAFDLTRAEEALIDRLADPRAELKVASAQALAVTASGTAQQAIAALANTDGDEAVRIAAYQAASESVRIIGRQLTDSQAQEVVAVVKSTASVPLRDAASELLGALDLPSEQIKSLILDSK